VTERLLCTAPLVRLARRLAGNEAFSVYAPLSAEGGPVEQRHRGAVPLAEVFRLHVGAI